MALEISLVVTCPYCQKPAVLEDSAVVYRWRSYGMIWRCAPCDAYVGTHKNSRQHAPLGRLANKELREWKKAAHRAFDPVWKNCNCGRARNGGECPHRVGVLRLGFG